MQIELKHIYKTFVGPTKALVDINLNVKNKEKVFITGQSGAGKSTLFGIIAGLLAPTSGQVLVNDTILDFESYATLSAHRRKVGVIFQDFKLLNDRSVYENIILPLYATGSPENLNEVEFVLESLNIKDLRDKNIQTLSGGQKQQVAIARTLVQKPDLIIADEPTGNLDLKTSYRVMDLFAEFNNTLIIASHNDELIKRYSQRTIQIHQGKIQNV
jgi:cell division transport system ATP-binding protein